MRSIAEYYFKDFFRCLEMWSNMVLTARCIFSIKFKTNKEMKKKNCKNLAHTPTMVQGEGVGWVDRPSPILGFCSVKAEQNKFTLIR